MVLTDIGESRVNGYLFVLRRSLGTFLPKEVADDAVREIESHVRERIAAAEASPNERVVLERILSELGPPLRVAQAYSAERTLDEAIVTGRMVPMLRAIWQLMATTVYGFFAALGLFSGYSAAVAFLAIAVMKPIFPENVGLWSHDGWHGYPTNLGILFPPPAGAHPMGGYWVIPFSLVAGLLLLVLMNRAARGFLRWCRRRRSSIMMASS